MRFIAPFLKDREFVQSGMVGGIAGKDVLTVTIADRSCVHGFLVKPTIQPLQYPATPACRHRAQASPLLAEQLH